MFITFSCVYIKVLLPNMIVSFASIGHTTFTTISIAIAVVVVESERSRITPEKIGHSIEVLKRECGEYSLDKIEIANSSSFSLLLYKQHSKIDI